MLLTPSRFRRAGLVLPLATAGALFASLAFGSAAFADEAPTPPTDAFGITLSANPSVGASLTVSGTGLVAGDDYQVTFETDQPGYGSLSTDSPTTSQILEPADAGNAITVTVSDMSQPDLEPVVVTSDVVAEGTTTTAPVTIVDQYGDSAAPRSGDLLRLGDFDFTGWSPQLSEDRATFQWARDGVDIEGQTGTYYSATDDDAGHSITLTVTSHVPGYDETSVTSAPTAVIRGSYFDTGTGEVVFSGSTKVGGTVTASLRTPVDGVTYAYAWLRGGVPIAGAVTATHLITAGDYTDGLSVEVTASKPYFDDESAGGTSVDVRPGSLATAGQKLTVTGAPTLGSTLKAILPSLPKGASVTYTWVDERGDIQSSSDLPTYKVTEFDAGHTVHPEATVTLTGYDDLTLTGAGSKVVGTFTITKAAKLNLDYGYARVGARLSMDDAWLNYDADRSGYQWYRDGKAIAKATSYSYTLATADAGHTIYGSETFTRSGFTPITAKTSGVTLKKLLSPKNPTVSGTPKVGKKLTAKAPSWGSGVKLQYQWVREGEPIKGATKLSYTLTKKDKGHYVYFVVLGSKAGYEDVSAFSKQYKIK